MKPKYGRYPSLYRKLIQSRYSESDFICLKDFCNNAIDS